MENVIQSLPQTKGFKEETSGYRVARKIHVEWGDLDAARHVNNQVYLRWFENTRVTYLNEMGKANDFSLLSDVGLVVAYQECKYIFPVTFPDQIWSLAKITEILDDRFIMSCKMMSERHDRIVAIASASLVPFHFESQKKIPLNQQIIAQIQSVEQQ